jgi:hypothetical protein
MRFMIIRKADAETEADVMPTQKLIKDMGDYMESMARAGVLIDGDGLKSSRNGARVAFHGGKPTVTDGPFAETKELVAGYAVIDVPSLAEAVEWVKKWPASDGHGEAVIEIRPFVTAEDFGDAYTPEEQAREARTFANAPSRRQL